MRYASLLIAMIAMTVTSIGWAAETDPAQQTLDQWAMEQQARAERQVLLDELMATMAEEMAAIQAEKNPAARKALMAAHRENMLEAMSLMRGMGGTQMSDVMSQHMASGQMHKGMTSAGNVHSPKSLTTSVRPRTEMTDAQRLTDLEIRVDMMQVMMESLLGDYVQ